MNIDQFQQEIRFGIPAELPEPKAYDTNINHAPKRKEILNEDEKRLALRNALRYFPKHLHAQLAPEFAEELKTYGRIYMYRYRPSYEMYARPIEDYPHKSRQAAAIMMMIQNNLDPRVAQHPHELITYGGNGAVFQNWAQYRLAMKYLSEMTDEQTLVMYSGHEARRLGAHERTGREPVWSDDGRFVHVYRSAGYRSRYDHHGAERCAQGGRRQYETLCDGRSWRHERCSAEGGKHRQGGQHHCRNQSEGGGEALRARLG